MQRWLAAEDRIACGFAARNWREAAVDRTDPEADSAAEAQDGKRSFLAGPNEAEEDTDSAKRTRKRSDDTRAEPAGCHLHKEGATYGKSLPL